MAFENFNGCIYVDYNLDDNDNLIIQPIANEWTVVQETGCSLLSQIPYQKQRVLIRDSSDNNMTEVFDMDVIPINSYKISYVHGLVWFHPSQIGKSFKATYGGIGVQYISSDRIMSGLNQQGRPIVIGDLNKVIEDYNNRIKPDYINNVKNDYTTNIKNNYINVIKPDAVDKINQLNVKIPILDQAIANYINSTNPTWITNADWTKTITVDNTNTFQLDLSSFNPVGDQISKFAYQAKGQLGCAELIKGEHWNISGATITLLNGLVFNKDDKVFINVYRGMAVTPIAGSNGGDLQNGSVPEPKLSLDVQNKLNTVYYETKNKFVATVANTTQFNVSSSYYTPNSTDRLTILQDNLELNLDKEYTLLGSLVTLGKPLAIGEEVYFKVAKNSVQNITNYLADGGILKEGSVGKSKLTLDVQTNLNNVNALTSEITNARNGEVNLDTRLDKSDVTLLLKQNITDNTLTTTNKTIVGAINQHELNIDSDIVKPILLSGVITGTIILERNKVYIATNLTIGDNSSLNGKWATIKTDGIINIGNNVEIFNVNFKTITTLLRINEVCQTEKSISLVIGNNVKIHDCIGDGVTIYASGKTGFDIENNEFLGGFSVGGTVQAFNNSSYGVIKNNKIHGSSHNGIAIHTSNNVLIEGNDCFKNGHSGVWTPYSTKLRIIGNKCHDHSVFDGIDTNFSADNYFIDFNANSEVLENECYNNHACGITIVGSNVMVSKNKCYNNGFNGIRLDRYRGNDTTEAYGVNLTDNVVYNNNTITTGHNISMASFVLSIIKGNTSFYDIPTSVDIKCYYLDGDKITVCENIGYKKNDSQQNERVDTIIGNNNVILGNKFGFNDKNVNVNNMYVDGSCMVKDLFACELGDINMFGTLNKGYFKIGYENTEDGNYYLVVGTKNGNKKVQLS